MKLTYLVFACVLLSVPGLALAHQGPHERLDRINHDIEAQPQSQPLYLKRGRLYLEIQRFDAALADFDTASRLGEADVVAFDYGILCFKTADMACALQQFDRCIESYPNHAAAYEYRARVYQQKGDKAAALADLQRYFDATDTPSPGLYVAASELAEELGSPERGLAILDDGLARLGIVPQLQRRAVEMELELENSGAAIARWESCSEVLRDSAEWKIEMARLLITDGQLDEAAVLLKEARKQLATLRPTPARIKSSEAITELEQQLRPAG